VRWYGFFAWIDSPNDAANLFVEFRLAVWAADAFQLVTVSLELLFEISHGIK
jgi:hypothetical protein